MSRKKFVPDDLPTLTEVVGESTGGFPTLTEVVGESAGDFPVQAEILETAPALPPLEIQEPSPQLLQNLQAHIENVFAQKLQQRLAEAQQHAIEHALAELKSELPQLIRDALAAPHDPA